MHGIKVSHCHFQKQLLNDKNDIREAIDRQEIKSGEVDFSDDLDYKHI